MGAPGPSLEPDAALANDPAYLFFVRMKAGELSKNLPTLAKQISAATETKQRSLAFAALLWRAVQEWSLANPPEKRDADQNKLLQQTLAVIHTAASQWQRDVVTQQLDPFLQRNRTIIRYAFMMSKGYTPPPPWLDLAGQAQSKRWGVAIDGERPLDLANHDAVNAFLQGHPWAAALRIRVTVVDGDVKCISPTGQANLQVRDFDPCDMLQTGAAPATLQLSTTQPYQRGLPAYYAVKLAAHMQYTYFDLLAVTYAQNAAALDKLENLEDVARSALADPNPLLVLPMQKRLANLQPTTLPAPGAPDSRWRPPSTAEIYAYRIIQRLAEFWMF
jgi:hypothetical protein